jgi:hypothetical protein
MLPAFPQAHCDGAFAPTSPSRRERLSSVMPVRNSGEKPAMTDLGTLNASRPAAVKAICKAVGGGVSNSTALVMGAASSQDRAARRSFTRRRTNEASVIFP